MDAHMTTLSAGILLFLVMDPLGNIPFFFAVLKEVPPRRRRLVIVRELLIALGVLLAFLVGGQYLLHWLQLKQESVSIAGGIVLFLIGIRMVFPPTEGGIFGKEGTGEPFIVPLAIPGVAGPSTMAVLLLFSTAQPGRIFEWGIALVLAWVATSIILITATYLLRWLGESILTALERLMGMLLVALSVQMCLTGVATYLQHSGTS